MTIQDITRLIVLLNNIRKLTPERFGGIFIYTGIQMLFVSAYLYFCIYTSKQLPPVNSLSIEFFGISSLGIPIK